MTNSNEISDKIIAFKLDITQLIKLSCLTLLTISPSFFSTKVIAESLNSKKSFTGRINYTVTGGTLRSNPDNIDACSLNATSSACLSNLPYGANINQAYLYWSGSGINIDNQVSFAGSSLTADRTYTDSFFLQVAREPNAKFPMLVWEGDQSLGGTTESFAFNGNTLSDSFNPL